MQTGYDRSGSWGFDMTYPIYKGTRSAKSFKEVRANHLVGTWCTYAFYCTLYELAGIFHSAEPSCTPANRARLRIEYTSRSLGFRGRFVITLPIHKATRLQQRAFGSNELHMCDASTHNSLGTRPW